MALANLADWSEEKTASACGSACGAADEKPAACGAADEDSTKAPAPETPAACGTACGTGDK